MNRLRLQDCAGLVIDVQDFFLASLPNQERMSFVRRFSAFADLMRYLGIPTLVTLERPVAKKGGLPDFLGQVTAVFEKDYFDLTRHPEIRSAVADLNRKQLIVVGCETDVCVLQSSLGLLALNFEVFLVEDLLFTSTRDLSVNRGFQVAACIDRLQKAGATFLSFKSLFHELVEAAEGTAPRQALCETFGPLPESLTDL